jgi:hypothetical protein
MLVERHPTYLLAPDFLDSVGNPMETAWGCWTFGQAAARTGRTGSRTCIVSSSDPVAMPSFAPTTITFFFVASKRI